MLPRQNRLTTSEEFSSTLRRGRRGANRIMVVSIAVPNSGTAILSSPNELTKPVQVGIVISKKQVPLATDRNRLKRRIRELMRSRLDQFAPGSSVVVRCLAPAGSLTSSQLGFELDKLIGRALRSKPRNVRGKGERSK